MLQVLLLFLNENRAEIAGSLFTLPAEVLPQPVLRECIDAVMNKLGIEATNEWALALRVGLYRRPASEFSWLFDIMKSHISSIIPSPSATTGGETTTTNTTAGIISKAWLFINVIMTELSVHDPATNAISDWVLNHLKTNGFAHEYSQVDSFPSFFLFFFLIYFFFFFFLHV